MDYTANKSQTALARREQLVVQEMPDEVLVYDLKTHKAHCLNKTAAFIRNHCDGQTSVAELARLLKDEIGSQVDASMIWYALDNLGRAGLLEGELVPPNRGVSRRRLMRQLGAGTLITIPMVASLLVPNAVHAQSVVVSNCKTAVGSGCSPTNPACNNCCCANGRLCVNGDCNGGPCINQNNVTC